MIRLENADQIELLQAAIDVAVDMFDSYCTHMAIAKILKRLENYEAGPDSPSSFEFPEED